MSGKYGGTIPIGPDDLRDTPRAVRDFKVEVGPLETWDRGDLFYVKATALVAVDDDGHTFVRRKIGRVVTGEFMETGDMEELKAKMLDAMARCKHEQMRDKE